MKNKNLLLVPLSLLLVSCTGKLLNLDEGLIDQENLKIISDINSLAINTFSKKEAVTTEYEYTEDFTNFTPKAKSDVKEDIIKNVEKFIERDEKARWVYDNFFNISNVEAYLTGNDPDTIEFVYNLNNGKTTFPKHNGESLALGRKTPYYIQRDNRWAYDELNPANIGISGCGPTSMAMVLSRLKNDPNITPPTIANDAKNYMGDEGISWSFFNDEASKYGYKVKDLNLDKNEMINALKTGPLIVSVSRGYFTLFGHIFVIDSFENDKFIINDPNSIKNSMRAWSFDEINDQILHIWQVY